MEMTRRLKLAIESQTRAIEDFNTKAGRQTTSLLRLTWAIAILTLIMAGGLGWQIYLALGGLRMIAASRVGWGKTRWGDRGGAEGEQDVPAAQWVIPAEPA